MRHLGIDYGGKRVGISLSNDDGTMAFAHSVIQNDETLFDQLEALIADEKIEQIVIGNSLDLEGNPNAVQEAIDDCISELTIRTGVPIEVYDERFSTQEAKHIQGKTDMIDASAAAIILNSYLSNRG